MAATAMDPVDIANILAQELLYQQVIPKRVKNVCFHGRKRNVTEGLKR